MVTLHVIIKVICVQFSLSQKAHHPISGGSSTLLVELYTRSNIH